MSKAVKASAAGIWTALSAVYLVWGSTYLAIRFAVETFPPFLMAGSRFLFSGLLLYFWMRFAAGEKAPSKAHWRPAAWAGFLLLTVGNGGVTLASQWVPSGIISLLVATVPLWTVLLIWGTRGGKAPDGRTWMGVGLGFAGVALLVLPGLDQGMSPGWIGGALLVVFTALVWSYGALFAKASPHPSSALLSTAMQMITGGAFQILIACLLGEPQKFSWEALSPSSLWAWVYLTLVGSLVGFTCFVWVLQKSNARLASTYAFVNPVIALLLGGWLGQEVVSPLVFLAALLVVGAVASISLAPRKKDLIRPL